MVWLTGGMFAIACSMIIALLGLILYKGLATHWQRPFGIYPTLNGEFEAGELQHRQTFNIARPSIASLDPKSRQKGEQFLGSNEQVEGLQLYLRTGNYDVTNRHFAYVPEISLNLDAASVRANRSFQPKDIWLLERREWGVLYGFPCRLEQSFVPETDTSYATLKVLLDNLDTLDPVPTAGDDAVGVKTELGQALKAALESVSRELMIQWQSELTAAAASDAMLQTTTDPSLLAKALQASHRKQAKRIVQIEVAKQRLGNLDRQLSKARIEVREAELRDRTALQELADEATQIATEKAIAEAASLELMRSMQEWRKRLVGEARSLTVLNQLEQAAKARYEEQKNPLSESLDRIQEKAGELPAVSKRAIDRSIAIADSVSRVQYELNLEIARLELGLQTEVLVLQLPTLDWLGDLPSLEKANSEPQPASFPSMRASTMGTELAELIGLQGLGESAAKVCEKVLLSPTQSLLVFDSAEGRRRYWLSEDSDTRATRVAMLRDKSVLVSDIVRMVEPNQLGWLGKLRLYAIRWFEFLFGQPREGGIEGGFFPALWGTIVMTLIMSIAVMPFGVIAALYMREYAKTGWVLSVIRISINNLAGVPSIVYGVFGLSFFCYTIGGYIDGGPVKAGFQPWPSAVWFVALASTALFGTIAFVLAAMASGSPAQMSRFRKRLASFGGLFWLLSLVGIVCLLVKSPFFDGFYQASLPNPTFGKGCLLWASCTLALLTLPVVIVATEEALAAVPNSIREGSYACGAGKWQTLQRIVLPYARPGIITGFILAMARGAGEVAPMMLVGAIPLVTELPLDLEFPFFHGSRSFMHLGFQIYSLGFQSQNSEAAKPMVFTATLLLLTIVTLLNVTAIWLRARLRKRFQGSQF